MHEGVISRLQDAAGKDRRLRFDEYQRIVLYDPELGYFSQSAERAGREGDFLTSPEVAPLFGEILARVLQEDAAALGAKTFHLVELGAGRGTLARDIWDALRFQPLAARIRFHLVEASPTARQRHPQTLSDVPAERWRSYAGIHELPTEPWEVGGLVANEFFDNLPVRRVMNAERLREIVVHVRKDALREELVDAPVELEAYLEAQGVRLALGQTAEVCLEAPTQLAAALGHFRRGTALIIDYGDEAQHLYRSDLFPHGTLAAHHGHATHTDFYRRPGEQDLTAHVNFTPLLSTLDAAGYKRRFFGTQMRFLLDHGFPEAFERRRGQVRDEFERLRWTLRAKQLYHPEAMGEAFRVLHARTP